MYPMPTPCFKVWGVSSPASPSSFKSNSLITLQSTSLPPSSPPTRSTSLSPTLAAPSTRLLRSTCVPPSSPPTRSTSLSPTLAAPSTRLLRSTCVPISTLFTPVTTSTLSTSLPSSSACSSLSVTQQLSSSVPCLITLNPCLDAPLTTNPSPSHSLPPNPCPNATVAIPSAVNKVLSWLGGDSPTKDPKPGPAASPKIKRKRGRPAKSGARRERGKKIPLIHDFIRGLLDDPTEEEVVSWEDKKEGTFRIRDSNEIAKLWGKLKNKQSMNYENFSRALRYHHNSKRPALIAVPGRLVFKFNTISKSRTNG